MGIVAFAYGLVCYVVFLGAFLYAIGFVGNLVVPKSIDSGVAGPLGQALLVNAALLGLFAVQHSVMARRGFKQWWTRIVPRSVERSTFVLITSLLLFLLFAYWQPMPASVWTVESAAGQGVLTALFWIGWVTVLLATFMINHFELFGLQQVFARLRGVEPGEPRFQKQYLYHYVRHPIMLGFVIAFWASASMSQGHLLFAVATTAYMIVGIVLEERDLTHVLGERYTAYQGEVPMLLPRPWRKT
jgi:protein-S-isoprenylcysteine O-methyltransferase Ste14